MFHIWKRVSIEKQSARIKHWYKCMICGDVRETATDHTLMGKYRLKLSPLRQTWIFIGKHRIQICGERPRKRTKIQNNVIVSKEPQYTFIDYCSKKLNCPFKIDDNLCGADIDLTCSSRVTEKVEI